jgi:hypothetical protein
MSASAVARRDSRTWLPYVVAGLFALLLVAQVGASWRGGDGTNVARDFKTFYCAGATANAGGDPYLVVPFERCGTPPGEPLPGFAAAGVWAAPIPPYDVALFRAVALLPYRAAAVLWLAVSLVALSFAVVAIASTTGAPLLIVFAAFALPLFYGNLEWGQLPPLVAGALVAAALAIRRGAFAWAGVAAAVTLLEPHIGLVVCAATFLWLPRARIAVAACVAALALAALAAVGPAVNVAYLHTVLPLQALAEVPAQNQYSFTWLAYVAGASQALALKLGSLSYVFAALLGIALAGLASRRRAMEPLVPALPAAAVVLGGAFVHDTQTAISLVPAAMLLGYVRHPHRLLLAGIALQAPVWYVDQWVQHPYSLVRIESLLAFAVVVGYGVGGDVRRRVAGGVLAAAAYLAVTYVLLHLPDRTLRVPESAAAYARALGDAVRYTTGAWGVHIRADAIARDSTLRALAFKLPVWCGLACVLAAAALTVVRELRRTAVPGPRPAP